MKKIKLNLAMLAMLVAVTAAFAFKAPVKQVKTTDVWYVYDSTKGLEDDPNAYTRFTGTPACTTGSELCAILAPDMGIHPDQNGVDSPDGEKDKN